MGRCTVNPRRRREKKENKAEVSSGVRQAAAWKTCRAATQSGFPEALCFVLHDVPQPLNKFWYDLACWEICLVNHLVKYKVQGISVFKEILKSFTSCRIANITIQKRHQCSAVYGQLPSESPSHLTRYPMTWVTFIDILLVKNVNYAGGEGGGHVFRSVEGLHATRCYTKFYQPPF